MNKQTFFLIMLVFATYYHISHAMEKENSDVELNDVEKSTFARLQKRVESDGYKAFIVPLLNICDPSASVRESLDAHIKAITSPPEEEDYPRDNDRFPCIIIVEKKKTDELNPSSQMLEEESFQLPVVILSSTASEYMVESYDTKRWKTNRAERDIDITPHWIHTMYIDHTNDSFWRSVLHYLTFPE